MRICDLAREYGVSRPTIYRVVYRGKHKDFSLYKSINKRFRCLEYGLKRLAKVEAGLGKKLKAEAKRYNKEYPGEMMHSDTKRLPLLEGESPFEKPEYIFVPSTTFPESCMPQSENPENHWKSGKSHQNLNGYVAQENRFQEQSPQKAGIDPISYLLQYS